MEKAIIKTLSYADIFDYPLKPYEIHKWLIGQKATTYKIEKAIGRLREKGKVKIKKGLTYLPGREVVVSKRLKREKQSKRYLLYAKVVAFVLRLIPWIQLIGISGSLAMENAEKESDIDLVLITSKGRMWLSRLFTIWITDFLGVRRKREDSKNEVGGKVCINLILEEERLKQETQDLYTAHEVLQMKVLFQRENIYKRFLEENNWTFEFLPNWATVKVQSSKYKVQSEKSKGYNKALDILEKVLGWMQKRYMNKPTGAERISEGALFFHPEDNRIKILQQYRLKLKNISTT